jgi:hypothetical protein
VEDLETMNEHTILFIVFWAIAQTLSIGILVGCGSAYTWWSFYLPKTKRRFKYILLVACVVDALCIFGVLRA